MEVTFRIALGKLSHQNVANAINSDIDQHCYRRLSHTVWACLGKRNTNKDKRTSCAHALSQLAIIPSKSRAALALLYNSFGRWVAPTRTMSMYNWGVKLDELIGVHFFRLIRSQRRIIVVCERMLPTNESQNHS